MGRIAVLATAVLFVAGPAVAQTCLGRISFADQPTHVQFDSLFGGGSQYLVGVAGGGASGFGGANVAFEDVDDPPGVSFNTALSVGGFGGGEVHVGRVAICPIGHGSYNFRSTATRSDGRTLDADGFVAGAGGAVGVAVVDTDVVQVIPTFRMGFEYFRANLTSGNDSTTQDGTQGVVQFGVGVVLSRIVSVTPGVKVTLFDDDNDVEFAILASFGFR